MSTNPDSAGISAPAHSRERPASTQSGYAMLFLLLVLFVGFFFNIGWIVDTADAGYDPTGPALLLVLTSIVFLFVLCGFYLLQPNQAAAILLFGSYKGTDRTTGLRWRLPWLTRTKISTRIHNITSDRIKVNDLRGNPVEIATNVVWRVTDTAQALFDVANYMEFVEIQIESAVRAIGARYPYDDLEIGTNVVWRVTDTAQALFDVANYMEFVEIQIESAVRAIGARYPYDDL